ncbi:MAG: molecular chaperone [Alkalispirochaeta sp.]
MRSVSFGHRPAVLGAIITTLLFIPTVTSAFQLVPMSAVIETDAPSPVEVFSINNTTPEAIAIQLRTVTREILPDGTEVNNDAREQLQVFPSQLIVPPGTTQTVRVRWTGATVPDRELPFRLVAEQLPINLDRETEDNSGVRFMLRYRATVYVRPPDTAPEITVLDVATDPEAETVTITVENRGSRHQSFPEGRIALTATGGSAADDGGEVILPISGIEAFIPVNLLAGSTRRVVIPLEQLPFAPEEVRFLFDR